MTVRTHPLLSALNKTSFFTITNSVIVSVWPSGRLAVWQSGFQALCILTSPTPQRATYLIDRRALMIIWIGSGRAGIIIYGILLLLARQLTLVFAGCAIQPDANGHVDIPSD